MRKNHPANAGAKPRPAADAWGRAAGGSLGSLIELNTMDQYVPGPPRPFDMRVAMGEVAQAKVPVEAGEEVVRATVMARWQFVSGSR